MKFCFKFPMSNFNSDLSRFKHICNIFHICFYHNSTYNSFIFIHTCPNNFQNGVIF